MRLIHRIGVNLPDIADRAELTALGLDLWIEPTLNLVSFDIDEADSRWPVVQAWLANHVHDHSEIVNTKFTKKEIDSAPWLAIRARFLHGYPQPDDDFGYREISYDLSEYCEECGTGMRQKAPLRMRGEPKWGKRGLIQLYWIPDELFVTPEVWEEVFRPLGIDSRKVLSRGGRKLETVVQLVVEGEADIDASSRVPLHCPVCGRLKYEVSTVGFFPPLAGRPTALLAKTRQWFGTGHAGFKHLIASRELRQALNAANVKGAAFDPLAESE